MAKFLLTWRAWASRRGISSHRGASGHFAAMLLGWIVEGGDMATVGDRGKTKRVRGLGSSIGHWPALRAVWEFLGEAGHV